MYFMTKYINTVATNQISNACTFQFPISRTNSNINRNECELVIYSFIFNLTSSFGTLIIARVYSRVFHVSVFHIHIGAASAFNRIAYCCTWLFPQFLIPFKSIVRFSLFELILNSIDKYIENEYIIYFYIMSHFFICSLVFFFFSLSLVVLMIIVFNWVGIVVVGLKI